MEIKAYLTEQLMRDDLNLENRKLLEDTLAFVTKEEQRLPEKWRQFVGSVGRIITDLNETRGEGDGVYRIQQMSVNGISSIYVSFENKEKKDWLFSVSAFHPTKKGVAFSSFDKIPQQFETLEEAMDAIESLAISFKKRL